MATSQPWRSRRRKPHQVDSQEELDPVFHALSRINGKINRMNKYQLQRQLESVGLNSNGVVEVLRKRLKNYYKREKLQSLPELEDDGPSHLVVIDYEATCVEPSPPDYIHEIIEFPAILIDRRTATVVDEFHSYCKPSLNPVLTPFCTGLTGITQEQVDAADDFPVVLRRFEDWMAKHDLRHGKRCYFITDGKWDFSGFLHMQCLLSGPPFPKWGRKWVNIKKVYGNFYKLKKPRILDMLANLGLEFEGRLHCGLDDARNLARVVIRLAQDGALLLPNERLVNGKFQPINEKERLRLAASTPDSSRSTAQRDDSRSDTPTSGEDESRIDEVSDEMKSLTVTNA